MFAYWLQGGRIDVGFLGAAQIDRHGNLNSTVIGDYATPNVRLPGGGGAPEIALGVRDVFVLLRHSPRAFVERLDFATEPRATTSASSSPTSASSSRPDGELTLVAVHPGVDRRGRRARRRAGSCGSRTTSGETEPPTDGRARPPCARCGRKDAA